MKKLIAYYGDSPVYVEGFPKDCARSCKGSVHVLPRKPVTVTNDEYEHIKSSYKWMLPKLKVVAEIKGEDKKSKDAGSGQPEPSSKGEKSKPKSEPKEESEKASDSGGGKPKKNKKTGKKN